MLAARDTSAQDRKAPCLKSWRYMGKKCVWASHNM